MNFRDPAIVALLATQWSEPDDGSWVWARYGITDAVRAEVVDLQGGRCSICAELVNLVIDHCHTTNRVRGLICGRCNTTLGSARDDGRRLRAKAARLRRAADYVEHAASSIVPRGIESVWLAAKGERRLPLVSAPTPVKAVARQALPAIHSILESWPTGHIRRFPSRRVVVECDGRIHWVMFCPNERVDYESNCDRMGLVEARPYGSKGVAVTGEVLCVDCTTPEQAIGFYALAFARTCEDTISYRGRPDVDSVGLLDWLRGSAARMLGGVDRNPWHSSSKTVLPGLVHIPWDITQSLRSRRGIVRLVSDHWIRTSSEWTILEFVNRRSVGREGSAA